MVLNFRSMKAILLGVILLLIVIAKASSSAQIDNTKSATKPANSPTKSEAKPALETKQTKETAVVETTVSKKETPPAKEDITSLPMGKGLPVIVRVGLYYVDIAEFDENGHSFTATVDLRLRWSDPRLSYPAGETPLGFKQVRGEDTEEKLKEIWSPEIVIGNIDGEPTYSERGLRIFPDGRVESMQRTTAKFITPFNAESFPFDRQKLRIEMVSRRDSVEKVMLDYRQDDLDFSQVAEGIEIEGWRLGLVDISRDQQVGWYGEEHPRMYVQLEVARQPSTSLAPIFIPLFASLLIPLIAMWLNRVEDGIFQIESFELTNIIIGGLFAVIALNFTINSEYQILASGDNTVSRLFGLNYLTLAASLLINILLFRFNLVQQFWGKYVQEQLYLYLVWAVPLMVLISSLAVLLVALV